MHMTAADKNFVLFLLLSRIQSADDYGDETHWVLPSLRPLPYAVVECSMWKERLRRALHIDVDW